MKFYLDSLFIFVVAIICNFYIFNNITYNWDFIGYMGVVNEYSEKNSAVVHHLTYSVLEKSIDVNKYELIEDGYRKVMSEDSEAFTENLSFYRIRPLYTGLIFVIYKIGIPLLLSIKLLSIIPIFLLIISIYFTLLTETKNFAISIFISLLISVSPLISKIATTTPDSLSAFLLFLVSLAYYYNVGKMKQLIIMILLIATRTDNIVWLLSLLILDTIRFNTNYILRYNALTFLFLMIFYGGINFIAGNQGFWIVFYNTLVERLNYPLSLTPKFNFKDYVTGQLFSLRYSLFTLTIMVFIFLAYLRFRRSVSIRGTNLVFATLLALIGRLILFPAYNSRYMLILFFIPLFFLLIEFFKHFRNNSNSFLSFTRIK